jgi:hypothetical protein
MNDVSPRPSAPRLVRRGQVRSRGLIVFLRKHRAFARIGIYTQLLAFVLVPGLHTVGHRADHDHGANGTRSAPSTATPRRLSRSLPRRCTTWSMSLRTAHTAPCPAAPSMPPGFPVTLRCPAMATAAPRISAQH